MLNRIHQKLGTAGFIISIVALVAALGGGAYAASGGLNGKQKKEVEKIAKKYAGKQGASGPAGPAGPAGTAGAKGDTGAPGTNGTNGTNGSNGAPGAPGKNGITGFTATLPAAETETGIWSAVATWPSGQTLSFPISYNIPLATPSEHVEYLNQEEAENSEGSGKCELKGSGFAATPIAPPGYLCVFTQVEEFGTLLNVGPSPVSVAEDATFGSLVWVKLEESTGPTDFRASNHGVWAVTAAEAAS
jgi:hypothetical protein